MPDILHRVGIQTKPQKVFEAIATLEGLSHWWITGTRGDPKLGGTIHFIPDGGGFDMKVTELKPNKLVKWKCIKGPKEWMGTEVAFHLKAEDGQTIVLFSHANWKEPVEFMHHCSTKWATFLLSLKNWLERGEGRPFPYDMKIHVGD
ncbi:MAG: SRPBCC domain-containing protein [Terriglobia bacterium]